MTPKEMITVEKEVYDAVLRNSVRVNDLEAENQQLKELLKECRVYVENCEQFNAYDFEMLKTIDNAIGEK